MHRQDAARASSAADNRAARSHANDIDYGRAWRLTSWLWDIGVRRRGGMMVSIRSRHHRRRPCGALVTVDSWISAVLSICGGCMLAGETDAVFGLLFHPLALSENSEHRLAIGADRGLTTSRLGRCRRGYRGRCGSFKIRESSSMK